MLNIGFQLYELTQRDEETLKLDPYFRVQSGITLGVGVTNGTFNLSVPRDRCLYIDTVVFSFNAEAATTWTQALVGLTDTIGITHRLSQDALSAGLGNAAGLTSRPKILLPPNIATLDFNGIRTGTTGAVTFTFWLSACLVPPGRIGRF